MLTLESDNTPRRSPSKITKVLGALACTACVGAAATWALTQANMSSANAQASLLNIPDDFKGKFTVSGLNFYDARRIHYQAEGSFTKTNDPDGNWILEGQLHGSDDGRENSEVSYYLKDSKIYSYHNGTLRCHNKKPAYQAWKFGLEKGISVQTGDLSSGIAKRIERSHGCKENDPIVFESGDFGKLVICADGDKSSKASAAKIYGMGWTLSLLKQDDVPEVVLPPSDVELECEAYDPSISVLDRKKKLYEEKGKRMLKLSKTGYPFANAKTEQRILGLLGRGSRSEGVDHRAPKETPWDSDSDSDIMTVLSSGFASGDEEEVIDWVTRLNRKSILGSVLDADQTYDGSAAAILSTTCYFMHGAGNGVSPEANDEEKTKVWLEEQETYYWGGFMTLWTAGINGDDEREGGCDKYSFSNMNTRERAWNENVVQEEAAVQICGSSGCKTGSNDYIYVHSMGGMIISAAMKNKVLKKKPGTTLAFSQSPLNGSAAAGYVKFLCTRNAGSGVLGATALVLRYAFNKRGYCYNKPDDVEGDYPKEAYESLMTDVSRPYTSWLNNDCDDKDHSGNENCIFIKYRYCGLDPCGLACGYHTQSDRLELASRLACNRKDEYCLDRTCIETKNRLRCNFRGCSWYSKCTEYETDHDGMVGQSSCEEGKGSENGDGDTSRMYYEETNHEDGTGRLGNGTSEFPLHWYEWVVTGDTWCNENKVECYCYWQWGTIDCEAAQEDLY